MYLFIYAFEYWNISFPASSNFGALLSSGFLIRFRYKDYLRKLFGYLTGEGKIKKIIY